MILATIGVVMVYSSSKIWAIYKNDSSIYYLIRQLIFYFIGISACFFISKVSYLKFQKYKNVFIIVAIILLVLVLVPGIGIVRGGARSWIGYGVFSFQPSEFVKISLIIYVANYLTKNKEEIDKISYLFPLLLVIVLIFGLIMLEPDFGTGMIIVLSILLMILLSGIKKRYIAISLLSGFAGMVFLVISEPYRLKRIFAFVNPWEDPLGAGFQSIQSLYAIGPNGLFGRGLFNSIQKHFFLPEPQTDFVYAILVEELGLIGGVVIIILFFVLFYNGILIALKSKDLFGTYLAIGITGSIFVQFFINVGVVIGLLPVTGVTLPFISYGGSSLIMNFIMMGILINISKTSNDDVC